MDSNKAKPLVRKFIGIYNANGTLLGEIKYIVKKVAGLTKCELCDITHTWKGKKKGFDQMFAKENIEIELLHDDEINESQRNAIVGERLPVVLREKVINDEV